MFLSEHASPQQEALCFSATFTFGLSTCCLLSALNKLFTLFKLSEHQRGGLACVWVFEHRPEMFFLFFLGWGCFRFRARKRREGRGCEEAGPSKSNQIHNRKRVENRTALGKPAPSKSSVLQSIYGKRARILFFSPVHLVIFYKNFNLHSPN